MSSITIKFDLDNAFFDGDDLGPGIAEILLGLAGQIRVQSRKFLAQPGQNFCVKDGNGNTVGKVTFGGVDEDWGDAENYIGRMHRNYVIEMLLGQGFDCCDVKGTESLQEQLLQCVKDGNLNLGQVRKHCGD